MVEWLIRTTYLKMRMGLSLLEDASTTLSLLELMLLEFT